MIAPDEGAAPSHAAPARSERIPFQADGVALDVAADAMVVRADGDAWQVLGPLVAARELGYAQSEPPMPAYALDLWMAPNPDGLDACDWARRRVLDARATGVAENAPLGGLPIDEHGAIDERQFEVVALGGEPACRVRYNQFDSYRYETYVARGGRVFAFAYVAELAANVPSAERQLAAYRELLATVRFDGER